MKSFKQFLNKRVLTVSALAKKHGVDKEYIERQLKHGIRVEHEHTTKLVVARRIALAHLGEDPDYYKKLKKIEGKKSLNESDRPSYQKLDYVFSGNDGKGYLKRIFHLRKTLSDKALGIRIGNTHGGGTPYSSQHVKSYLEKHKDHPHYVGPANEGSVPNPEHRVHSIVGLHALGHSAGAIAKMLHTDDDPVTKNKVIGIIARNRSRKDEIVSHINAGNEPPEYAAHKNKPVVVNKGGKSTWNQYVKK